MAETKTKKASAASIQDSLWDILRDVGAVKKAEANTEYGSLGGPSSSPTADIDDGTKPNSEGAQSAANEKAVKDQKDVTGPPPDTVSTDGGASLKETEAKNSIGPVQSPTGDDPKTEDNITTKIEDPGTSGAMKAENDVKSASEKFASMSFDELYKYTSQLGDEILAAVAVEMNMTAKAASAAPAPVTKEAEAPVSPTPQATEEASIEAQRQAWMQTKQATYESCILEAYEMAKAASEILLAKEAELAEAETARRKQAKLPRTGVKRANSPEEMAAMAAMAGGGGGAAPPEAAMDPAAMAGGAGGMPPGTEGGEGGMPPGMEGGEGGEGNPLDQALAVLMEQGLTPEQAIQVLEQALQQGPPEGSPEAAEPKQASEWKNKIAADINFFKAAAARRDAGEFEFTTAKNAAQKALRTNIRNYLRERVRRSA